MQRKAQKRAVQDNSGSSDARIALDFTLAGQQVTCGWPVVSSSSEEESRGGKEVSVESSSN
jgi:hypothetical protein